MNTITTIDNEYVTLSYYPDTKIVHHVFTPKIGGQNLQEALNTGIDLLRTYGAQKWLSDNRAIDAHTDEETEWINTYWLPNAVDAGWKYWALVVPNGVMARINMTEFVQSFYEMGVRIMVFVDPDDAMHWLEKVDR